MCVPLAQTVLIQPMGRGITQAWGVLVVVCWGVLREEGE